MAPLLGECRKQLIALKTFIIITTTTIIIIIIIIKCLNYMYIIYRNI